MTAISADFSLGFSEVAVAFFVWWREPRIPDVTIASD